MMPLDNPVFWSIANHVYYGVYAMYDQIVVGIDQSYQNTGLSIAADGQLKMVSSIDLSKCKTNTHKRDMLMGCVDRVCSICAPRALDLCVVIERIRLYSHNKISMDYIRAMGALNAVIVDVCACRGVPVYSIDTRAWRCAVLGSSTPQDNDMGVPSAKWPCVQWVISMGFETSILRPVNGRRRKGTFVRDGTRYMYDNDAADSAGIAMSWFAADPDKFVQEK